MRRFAILFAVLMVLLLVGYQAFPQTASLSGGVVDKSGGVIPGAEVLVKNDGTGAEFKTVTVENGTFIVPALETGTYTVTISMPNFKQAIIRNVKIDVGKPATVKVVLEVGAPSDTVLVTAGAEILQTQSATVATTIQGRQITDLPFISRDGLDLVLLLPGTNTPGRPRTSTIDGLPKSSINITIDGTNVQDNLIKNGDGFFTYVRPRVDAVEEVTVSTANPGAESAGEGAVQVKFVTRSGNNDFHGSLYEYHRNPALNANYWFNNRDKRAPAGWNWNQPYVAPKDRILLNQFGGRLGGPITIPGLFSGKDKAFFFVNYEEYRIPEAYSRVRQVMHPRTQQGFVRYVATDASGVKSIKEVDLMSLANKNGQIATFDPTIQKLLADIRTATGTTGSVEVVEDPATVANPNLQRYTFTNTGWQNRYFPTVRFDFNITSQHKIENVWNYQAFRGAVDFLNGTDWMFPGFPSKGSQGSNRFTNTTALRSTITPRIVNEARLGITGGTVLFFADAGPGDFSGPVANQGGFNLGISAAGISNATAVSWPSRRNTPVKQFQDTLSWSRGVHNLSFGFSFTNLFSWQYDKQLVPDIGFGVHLYDPAYSLFTAANRPVNFPGASSTDASRARSIYSVLTGRVTSISADAQLDEKSGQYVYTGPGIGRFREREMGLFAQDSWRARPNLTLNYGLRWEIQFPLISPLSTYSKITLADVYGISGLNNLFRAGVMTGEETTYKQYQAGERLYGTMWKNFGPSFGFAWTPTFDRGPLGKFVGSAGRTVLRGGFSIAYNRDDMDSMSSILNSTPGRWFSANRSMDLENLVTNTGSDVLPVLFRQTSRLGPPNFTKTPVYPNTGTIDDGGGVFDPNLRVPYVLSWNFGLQREISRDTVIEVRYTGNRGLQLAADYSVNELNLLQNGLIDEFKIAQKNLYANMAATGEGTFAYTGIPGTAPLPIALAYLDGIGSSGAGNPNNYQSSGWYDYAWALSKFWPSPSSYASNLDDDPTQRANAAAAGMPANFFMANPDKRGGPYWKGNGYRSYYDAATIEVRRRMAKGLMVQANYAFARTFDNNQYSFLTGWVKSPSIYATPHAFKANWIWELPIGRGKGLFNGMSAIPNRIFGDWEFHGGARIQSGAPLFIRDIQLVGMTRQQLQEAMTVRFDDKNGIVYWLPQDIIDNTIKAFNDDYTSPTGYSGYGVPTGRYIKPAGGSDCLPLYTSMCGHGGFTLRGPMFTRFDLSVVKKIKFNERANFEFRAEFLNAFNNVNFLIGNPSSDWTELGSFGSSGFGRITNAYRDLSTTNDPGGRMIQFVARINF